MRVPGRYLRLRHVVFPRLSANAVGHYTRVRNREGGEMPDETTLSDDDIGTTWAEGESVGTTADADGDDMDADTDDTESDADEDDA